MKADPPSAAQALQTTLWSIFLPAALAIVAQGTLHAGINDWTNVGPEGGSFWQLAVDPQNPATIYGLTGVGLFKSKDKGASWNNAGLNGFAVYTLIIDPQQPTILYAAASNSSQEEDTLIHVFKSTDGGDSWNESDSGLPGCCVGTLAIDPQNTGTLYALNGQGGPGLGLYRSTDDGASWGMIYAPPSGFHFVDMTIDPKDPGTLYVVADGPGRSALFKSVDGGTSWSEADDGGLRGGCCPGTGLTIDPTSPATIYATQRVGSVYKTTDGAESWHPVSAVPIPLTNQGCCVSPIVIDPRDSNTLYASYCSQVPGQPGAVFKSADGGASWRASGAIPLSPFPCKPVAIDPRNSDTLYATTSSGVYRSTDRGVTFAPYSRARAIAVFSVALDPQRSGTVLAGVDRTGLNGASIFQSTDAGMSWRAAGTDLGDGWVVALAIDPQNASLVYAGTGQSECGWSPSKIFRSVDGGTSWIDTQSDVDCLSSIVIDPRTAGTVYAGSRYAGFLFYRGTGLGPGVKKSTDGGSSWNDVSSGLPVTFYGPAVYALAIDPQNTRTLFASECGGGAGDCRVFKSTDGGAHWVETKPGIPASPAALAVDPQSPSTVYAAVATGGLWKSVNGGANWRNIFPANVYALAINPQDAATIYSGTDTGLARSTDGGENWTTIPGGPGRVTVLALDPQDPDTVYAGGQGGLFAIRFAPVPMSPQKVLRSHIYD